MNEIPFLYKYLNFNSLYCLKIWILLVIFRSNNSTSPLDIPPFENDSFIFKGKENE